MRLSHNVLNETSKVTSSYGYSLIIGAINHVVTWWGLQLRHRQERPWIALVGIPLEAVAVAIAGLWLYELLLIIPLLWLSPWEEPWIWILGVEEAAFGIQWAYIGIYALLTWDHAIIVVGLIWTGYAGVVVVLGAVNRWHYKRRWGW